MTALVFGIGELQMVLWAHTFLIKSKMGHWLFFWDSGLL